jgi:hypothetical protein
MRFTLDRAMRRFVVSALTAACAGSALLASIATGVAAAQGDGSAFRGVLVEPSTLYIRATDWKGPLDPFDKAGATVLLSGPGVPALFRHGERPPHTTLLLRSRTGRSVYGRIDFLPPDGRDNPTVARAIVSVPGNVDPGRYKVTAPISSRSTGSPQLSVELEVAHGFAWAVLAILLGAFAAGRRRNAVQTLAIALLVATAYVATVYGPTWGTLLDYAGAVAAGFVGQLVIGRLAARRLK